MDEVVLSPEGRRIQALTLVIACLLKAMPKTARERAIALMENIDQPYGEAADIVMQLRTERELIKGHLLAMSQKRL